MSENDKFQLIILFYVNNSGTQNCVANSATFNNLILLVF